MKKCGERRKDGGREGRGFPCQSSDLQLYFAGSGVRKGLVQKVLSETAFDGRVMGRLERLRDQTWDLYFCFTEIQVLFFHFFRLGGDPNVAGEGRGG